MQVPSPCLPLFRRYGSEKESIRKRMKMIMIVMMMIMNNPDENAKSLKDCIMWFFEPS